MKRRSEKFGLEFEVLKTGAVRFGDGTTYEPDEIEKIRGLSEEDMKVVHEVKRLFEGKIINRRRR